MSDNLQVLREQVARLKADLPVLVMSGDGTDITRREIARLESAIVEVEAIAAAAADRAAGGRQKRVASRAGEIVEATVNHIEMRLAAHQPPAPPEKDY